MPVVVIGKNTGDDYSGFEDNWLDTDSPSYNMGAHGSGYCGPLGTRVLKSIHRWILEDIPAGADISSATLNLYDTNWSERSADCTITLYKISDANGDWVVGTSGGGEQAGSSCNYRKVFDTTSWAGSSGLSTAGTDYVDTSLGSAVFTDGVSGYRSITLNADGLSVLESWCGESTNNGILIVGTGSSGCWTEWVSSEGSDGSRPYLSVTYTAGGAGSALPKIMLSMNQFAGGMQ